MGREGAGIGNCKVFWIFGGTGEGTNKNDIGIGGINM